MNQDKPNVEQNKKKESKRMSNKKYYETHKEFVNSYVCEYIKNRKQIDDEFRTRMNEYCKKRYDEEARQRKREYYLKRKTEKALQNK